MDSGTPSDGGRLIVGSWTVDPAADEIARDGATVKLEPRKMQLLLALARRPGEVVTFDDLLDAVWPGLVVTQSSVYQSVAQLRKTLGDNRSTPDYIATIPRKGYRLVAPVRPAGPRPLAVAPDEPVPSSPVVLPPAPPTAPTSRPRRRWLAGAAVGVGVGAAIGAAGWWRWRTPALPQGDVRIAVIPFSDRSEGHLEQASADGLANDVIHRFERADRVHVLARNSSFTFRSGGDERALLRAVQQQLAADYALVGDLSRLKARVHVAVRLFALASGEAVWSSVFDVPDERLAELPGDIAGGALRSLGLPDPRPPELNPLDAYELYLLGLNALQMQRTVEGIRKARDYFQHAIDTDPTYARAYAGLASTWMAQALYGVGLNLREASAHAQPLIDKALAIDPELLEGLLAQGKLFFLTNWGDANRARTLIQKAVDLYPGSAEARFDLGATYAYDEQPRAAIPHYAMAASLDPLNYLIQSRWGQDATFSGDYESARAHFARAGTLLPKNPWRFLGPGQADYARGRLDDAVANYKLQLEQDPRRPGVWDELAWFYLDLGMSGDARAAFEKKAALSPENPEIRLDAANVALAERGRAGPAAASGIDKPIPGQWEIDRLKLQAIVAREPERAALDSLVAAMRADTQPWVGSYWVFFGSLASLDLAALYAQIGARSAANPLLDEAQTMLERLEARGNVFHTIPFLKARVAALRGQPDLAISLLGRAVDAGWRRAWYVPYDLAFGSIRDDPRVRRLMDKVRVELATQRAHLG